MKEIFKKYYFNIIIILAYIIIACLVYGIWFQALWNLWYVTLITIVLIIAVGFVIGYFYIKSLIKKNENSIENQE